MRFIRAATQGAAATSGPSLTPQVRSAGSSQARQARLVGADEVYFVPAGSEAELQSGALTWCSFGVVRVKSGGKYVGTAVIHRGLGPQSIVDQAIERNLKERVNLENIESEHIATYKAPNTKTSDTARLVYKQMKQVEAGSHDCTAESLNNSLVSVLKVDPAAMKEEMVSTGALFSGKSSCSVTVQMTGEVTVSDMEGPHDTGGCTVQ